MTNGMGAGKGEKEREIGRGRQGTVGRIDQFTKLYAKRTCKSARSNNKNKDNSARTVYNKKQQQSQQQRQRQR